MSVEQRYFINSIKADAKVFATAVRGHWGIENRLHWCLDVTFREDESRIRKGNAPAIMTTIRHFCLNIFQKHAFLPVSTLGNMMRYICKFSSTEPGHGSILVESI